MFCLTALLCWGIGLQGHGAVDPLSVVGDDGVNSRLSNLATFLPSIRSDAHRHSIVEQRTPRVAIAAVLLPEWLITGVWANPVRTHHVSCELSAIVVTAFAASRVEDVHYHLFELVGPGAQVVHGTPASCVHLFSGGRIGSSRSQESHWFNSLSDVDWTVQLDQSYVIIIIVLAVAWVVVKLQNVKCLLRFLRFAQRMDTQHDFPPIRTSRQTVNCRHHPLI